MSSLQWVVSRLGLLALLGSVHCWPSSSTIDVTAVVAEALPMPPGQVESALSIPAVGRTQECTQISYATLGRILKSRGVELLNPAADSAGALYRASRVVLADGLDANTRSGPPHLWSVAAMRLFDILLAAAPELIANLPQRADCQVDGVGPTLIDDQGCNARGLACLIGLPVSTELVAQCNALLQAAADNPSGKSLAVAAVAAPFYLCE